MRSESNIERESDSILIPIVVFIFIMIFSIILYKYNQTVSRINLIWIIIISLVTFLLFYIKIKITNVGDYSNISYFILFLFLFSFIK